MSDGRKQVGNKQYCIIPIPYLRKHHGLRMAINETQVYIVSEGEDRRIMRDHFQLAAFFDRNDVFFEERGFFAVVWHRSSKPMPFITPVHCIFEGGNQFTVFSYNRTAAMIKV